MNLNFPKIHLKKIGISSFQNEAAFDQVFQDACFKSYVFKLRAKVETYNVRKITCQQPFSVNKKPYSFRMKYQYNYFESQMLSNKNQCPVIVEFKIFVTLLIQVIISSQKFVERTSNVKI